MVALLSSAARSTSWRRVSTELCCVCVCFFQAEDGIRDLVRSRGLGDVYKRQKLHVMARRSSYESWNCSVALLQRTTADTEQRVNLSLIHI